MKTHRWGAVVRSCVLCVVGLGAASALAVEAEVPAFVDSTARLVRTPGTVLSLGKDVYVGPFAKVSALGHEVRVGAKSNLQDNVTVTAKKGPVRLGQRVILAHGATVNGPANLGLTTEGVCPCDPVEVAPGVVEWPTTCAAPPAACPSFVSFNAVVDGATLQKNAMVSALARVAPGVTIPSGRKVLPGAHVKSQAEVADKTVEVTEADLEFMHGVVHVNVTFAHGYGELKAWDPNLVRGISVDPGYSDFNPWQDTPTLAGVWGYDPTFRNRIIGDVRLSDTQVVLDGVMGQQVSLRADEGEPFVVEGISVMESKTTFHALEHSHLHMGPGGSYGYRSVVHGGPTPFGAGAEAANVTVTGHDFTLGAESVFYRSRAADGVTVGFRSVVQQCDLPAGFEVPDRTVLVCAGVPAAEALLSAPRVQW